MPFGPTAPHLLNAAASVPSWMEGGPLRVLAWIGTSLLIFATVQRIVSSSASSSLAPTGAIARSILASSLRIIGFAVGVFGLVVLLSWLADKQGIFGTIGNGVGGLLLFAAAFVAGLFIARQFLAPPWWRLNAWESSTLASPFGLTDAAGWIRDDVRDLLASLRLVTRIVILAGVPLATLNALVIFGPRSTFTVIYGGLFICYVALVVALFTANRIPRVLLTRLQELRTVARHIANGDLSARASYSDAGEYEELGELVADVNSMARVLESREAENRALNAQLHQALNVEQERSTRDPLTRLRNHRYFQEALAAELYRCSRTGEQTTIAMLDLDDFKMVNDTFGHQEGDAVLIRTAAAFTQTLRPYDLPARLGGEEFGVIFPSTSPEEAKMVMDRIMQVLATGGPNGAKQTFSGGIATFPTHAQDQATLCQLADSSSYAAKLNGKAHTVIFDPSKIQNIDEDDRVNTRERDAQLRAARTLVKGVDELEGLGTAHSENVGRLSAQIATAMGYDDTYAQQMYLCGLLHDVGKLGLDQALVQKSSQLTAEEYEQVKRHPELSAQIVTNAGLGDIAAWVRHHHEHFDGTGYPLGLAGQDIPLGSRIVLAAEAFDVMTSDRAYRRAMSLNDATQELLRGAGARFDPDVVMTLVQLVRSGEVKPAGGSAPAGQAGFPHHRAA
ncbi:MAG: diguanylate cyclase [Thermoleophilia bacterium]|nr:diguanylate cyclase [Thermoleophilia bacterium]